MEGWAAATLLPSPVLRTSVYQRQDGLDHLFFLGEDSIPVCNLFVVVHQTGGGVPYVIAALLRLHRLSDGTVEHGWRDVFAQLHVVGALLRACLGPSVHPEWASRATPLPPRALSLSLCVCYDYRLCRRRYCTRTRGIGDQKGGELVYMEAGSGPRTKPLQRHQ